MIRRSVRHIITLLGLLALILLVILGLTRVGRRSALGVSTPFVYAWRNLERSVATAIEWLMPGQDTRTQELLDAQTALRLAEIDAAASDELRRENSELRALLRLPTLPYWRVLVAPVLTRDPASWNMGFTIGRGSADGITVGALVMAGPAVLGRISQVYEHSAEVVTIASPSCRFSVVVTGTAATGVLKGLGGFGGHPEPLCQVDFLPRDLPLQVGQRVLTSGLGGWMPGGMPIGVIIANERGEVREIVDQARSRLIVEPLADFSLTRFVAVLCPQPQLSEAAVIE